MLRHELGEDRYRERLLRLLCAARQKDLVGFQNARERRESLRGWILSVGQSAVEFHGARHDDGSGNRAELAEPLGILFILSGDQVDLFQSPAGEETNPLVSPQALVAEPAVDDGDLRAELFGRGNEVGPQLQLGQHE